MPDIVVNMLQVPTVLMDGSPVAFPFKRVDALFYYMVCRRSATRRELVALLWESSSEEVGYKNLRHTLYVLKKCLGVDLLVSPQKSLLQLNPEIPLDCDYNRFVEQGDFEAYQGPFLQGFAVKNAFSYEEWVERVREKLREIHLGLLARLAREAAERGDAAEAERRALDYLRDDPLDEQMAVFLMRHYRGRALYPKVAKTYQRLRECFEEELGIAPLAETTALYYDIMNEWNATAVDVERESGGFLPEGRAELLGRLQGELRAFCGETGQRRPALLLRGEAGVGKSFLLDQLLRRADFDGLLVLTGRCYQSETQQAFKPWDAVMLAVAGYVVDNGVTVPERVRSAVSDVFSIFAGESGAQGSAGERHDEQAVIDGVLLILSMLGRRRRVLLVFEDLHWMDAASVRLLDSVLRRLPPGLLMGVGTCRDILTPATERAFRAAVEDKLLTMFELGCLSAEDTEALLRRELGWTLAPHVANRVYEETGGNPMLLVELVRSLPDPESAEALLLGSRRLLDRRLAGLSTQALQLLDIVSLFNEQAPCDMLTAIMGKSAAELLAVCEELSRRSLVVERRLDDGAGALAFTYARLREMVYQQQSYFKRRPLHLRVARLLERRADRPDPGLYARMAYHFAQAGDRVSALRCRIERLTLEIEACCEPPCMLSRVPADLAGRPGLADRLADLEAELSLLRRQADQPEAFERPEALLLLSRGRLCLYRGENEAGLAALDRLERHAVCAADPALLLCLHRLLALHHRAMGEVERLGERVAAGTRLAEQTGDELERAHFHRLRGEHFSMLGRYDKSAYYLQECLDALGRLRDAPRYLPAVAMAHGALGDDGWRQRDFSAACASYRRAVGIFDETGPLPGAAGVYVGYARAARALGDEAMARALFSRALEICEATGELTGRAVAESGVAYYLALDGDHAAAAECLSRARSNAQRRGAPLENGLVLCVMAQLRQTLDQLRARGNPLDQLLNRPLEVYCRRGIHALEGLPDAHELSALKACLRYSIANARPFTVPELYSKNKQFMTE